MALVSCPDCGMRISSKADICLRCGFPLAKFFPIQFDGYYRTFEKGAFVKFFPDNHYLRGGKISISSFLAKMNGECGAEENSMEDNEWNDTIINKILESMHDYSAEDRRRSFAVTTGEWVLTPSGIIFDSGESVLEFFSVSKHRSPLHFYSYDWQLMCEYDFNYISTDELDSLFKRLYNHRGEMFYDNRSKNTFTYRIYSKDEMYINLLGDSNKFYFTWDIMEWFFFFNIKNYNDFTYAVEYEESYQYIASEIEELDEHIIFCILALINDQRIAW